MSTETETPAPRRRLIVLLPLLVFLGLAGLFLLQLLSGRDVAESAVGADRPAGAADQPAGAGRVITCPGSDSKAFAGKVTLVNVLASWCAPCREEHPVLLALSQDKRFGMAGAELQGPAGKCAPLPRRSRQSVPGDRRRRSRPHGDRLGRLRRAGNLRHRQGRQDRLQACRPADGGVGEGRCCCRRSKRRWRHRVRRWRQASSSGRLRGHLLPVGEKRRDVGACSLLSPRGEVGLPELLLAIRFGNPGEGAVPHVERV